MLPALHLQSAQPAAAHLKAAGENGLAREAANHAAVQQAAVHQAAVGLAAAEQAIGEKVVLGGAALKETGVGEPVAWDELLPGLLVGEQIGVGRRCLVFAASCEGEDVVVKRYRPHAIVKHSELADMPLAEFEYRRNQACYSVPGLDRNVARPFGYYVGASAQWLVQQRVHGQLCSDSSVDWSEPQWRALRERLLELVALAHRAGLYDLDLHPGNIMLSRTSGDAEPILFDFNLVPFIDRRRLTLDGWLYRLGLVSASYRDLRRVRKRFR